MSHSYGPFNISSLLSNKFDPVWYRTTYPDLAEEQDLLGHYIAFGWREERDPTEMFSTSDYLASNPDVRATGIEPFSHYLDFGREEFRLALPSRHSPLRHRREFVEGTNFPLTELSDEDFRSGAYAFAAGMPGTDRWLALAHFASVGLRQPPLLASARPSPRLLHALTSVMRDDRPQDALFCCKLAIDRGAADVALYQTMGELYEVLGAPAMASDCYRAAIVQDPTNSRAHVSLARRFIASGDFTRGMAQYARAAELDTSRLFAHQERTSAAAQNFWAQLAIANDLAACAEDDRARAAVATAVNEYLRVVRDSAPVPHLPSKLIDKRLPRVAIYGFTGIPQCLLYRIRQKLDQLDYAGVPAEFFSQDKGARLIQRLALFDVLIVYRLPAFPEVIDVISTARALGLKCIYDIDDLTFSDTYPPSRDTLGALSPFEYAPLVTGRVLYRKAMDLCEYGMASTETLKSEMSGIFPSENCLLARNALSQIHLDAIAKIEQTPRPDRREFVIFYGSGTNTHNADFAMIAGPLAAVLSRHPHVNLHIIGPVELGPEFAHLGNQIRQTDFTSDISAYWSELSLADVNLAPLEASRFNDAKSEIKWVEAAMLGVPSIASNGGAYSGVIVHGYNGFIASGIPEFELILQQIIQDPDILRRVGSECRRQVLSDYSLDSGREQLLTGILSTFSPPPERRRSLVLMVNVFYPPASIGGATRIIQQSAVDLRSLHGEEFEVEVFCGRAQNDGPGRMDRYEWEGIPITTMCPTGDLDLVEHSVETESRFASVIDRLKPDLVHVHCIQDLGSSIIDVLRDRGIPYLVTAHDGWWISDSEFLVDDVGRPVTTTKAWGDRRRLDRLRDCLLAAEATLCVSEHHAQIYRSRGITNAVAFENPVDEITDITSPPDDGKVWLGFFGGTHPQKGLKQLKDALRRAHFDNIRFLVVDHWMPEGAERYEWWGDNRVHFVGKTAFSGVGRLYSKVHGVLVISTALESFGLVAREAMGAGKWLISSNRGAIAGLVDPGVNGLLIDPMRVGSMISALDQIDIDPERFRSPPPIRPAPPPRSREQVTHELAALYRSIIGSVTEREYQNPPSPA